jgi:hypothetical protein
MQKMHSTDIYTYVPNVRNVRKTDIADIADKR